MMAGLIWREKPDGTRALAYPVYLAGALAAWAMIYVLHDKFMPAARPALAHGHHRGADVGVITAAASLAAPVAEPPAAEAAEARSYRLRSKEPGAGRPKHRHAERADAEAEIDPIDETLHSAASASTSDPTAAGFAPLLPALPPEAPGEAPARMARPQLLGYRDGSADLGAADSSAVRADAAPALARGAVLPVYLLTTVDTSNPAAVLQFAVAEDVYSHGVLRLHFGTRLLGRFFGRPMRDRLTLAVDTVLYPDGRHEPITATAVEADEQGADIRPGIAASFVPPPAWAQAAPYLADFATGFLGLLQSRAQQGAAIGVGGVTLATAVPEDAKGPAYQASSQAIGDFTRARLREWEDRYAAYYYIPAGTACWLQLDADFAGAYSHAP